MGIINIVKSYPEIFGERSDGINEDDAWRIIASAKSYRSNIQKNVISIHDKLNVVFKLFNLELRDEAVEIAVLVLKYAIKEQQYSVAQQICKLLVRDSFLQGNISSAHKYNTLYKRYTDLIELEYQTELKFCDIISSYEKGLEFDELEIIRGLQLIEEKVPFDSLMYHYYYHSFQLMISSDSEYEEKLQNAVTYFENLNYNYSVYLSSFVIKLVYHYQANGNNIKAEDLIVRHIGKCKEGSTFWFRYLRTAWLLYFSDGDMIKSNDCIKKSFACNKFQDLSDKDKAEWNQFRNSN